jgi:hypothetical protein
MVEIKKIPGGYRVDGFELKNGKCGCTSIARCCYSWSKVKLKDSNMVEFPAKTTSPDTKDNFHWGYTVKKENITVTVSVEDTKDKEIFSGYIPPSVHEWREKGWDVLNSESDRADGTVWRCAMCRKMRKEHPLIRFLMSGSALDVDKEFLKKLDSTVSLDL